MSLRERLKRFVPMSSRTLNSRLDSILGKMKILEENDRELTRYLSVLEWKNNELKKLLYYHLDPKLYPHAIEEWYKDQTGNVLNLENPQTYNEKIQWMKLYDPDPRKTLLADKLLVRDWVKEKLGGGGISDSFTGSLSPRRGDRFRCSSRFFCAESQPWRRDEHYCPQQSRSQL